MSDGCSTERNIPATIARPAKRKNRRANRSPKKKQAPIVEKTG